MLIRLFVLFCFFFLPPYFCSSHFSQTTVSFCRSTCVPLAGVSNAANMSSAGKCVSDCMMKALADNCQEKDAMDCGYQTELYRDSRENVDDLRMEDTVQLDIAKGKLCKEPAAADGKLYRYGQHGRSGKQIQTDAERFKSPEFAFCPMPCSEISYSVKSVRSKLSFPVFLKQISPHYLTR